MKRIHIKVENEVTKRLQELDFELAARKSIISTLMDQHISDPDTSFLSSPVFTTFYGEYTKMNSEWEQLKKNVQFTCLPDWMRKYDLTWRLDTFNLTFEIDLPDTVSDAELDGFEVEYM